MSRARVLPLVVIVVLVSLLVASKVFGWADAFSVEALRAHLKAAGWWGIAAFFFAMVFSNVLSVPTVVFVIAALLSFDPVVGVPLSFFGSLAAASNSYVVGRLLRSKKTSDDVEQEAPGRLKAWMRKLLATVDEHPLRVVVLLRLVLFVSGPVNLALAATGMRYRTYALGTAVGMVPVIAFYTISLRCLA